jgi:hypothetical protein
MKFSPDQVRRAARVLYPLEWAHYPAEAIIIALEYLGNIEDPQDAAALEESSVPSSNETMSYEELIEKLTQVITRKQIHISAAAKSLGVHPVTLRSWIQRDTTPRADKVKQIQQFLAELNL